MYTNRFPRVAVIGVLLLVVAAAACGGSSSSSNGGGPKSKATTSTAPLGSGPATANLTFAGDASVAGAVTSPAISCNFPSLDGLTMTVLGGTKDPNASTFMFVGSNGVTVRIASGSGATYLQRVFTGAGVTGFDAARGAHLSAALREAGGSTSAAKKALPAVTSVNGDIHCGGQRPGSSTIVLSGDTDLGAIAGKQNPVRVACTTNAQGHFVNAVGMVNVGSNRALVFVNGQPKGFSVVVEGAGSQALSFMSTSGAQVTTTAKGMHVSGDAVEQAAGGGTHTVHVTGGAVCGATGG